MAKGKYSSKFTGPTAELFNNYYEDTNTVMRRKIASNATSQSKTNSTKQQKAVLSSKPQQQKKLNSSNSNALKQTATFLNSKQKYQQEFPSLSQSYKTQSTSKPKPQPQQQKLQQMKPKPQQQKMVFSRSAAPKTRMSPSSFTSKQIEELLHEFYGLCQSYNGMNYFGMAALLKNNWSMSQGKWVNSASAMALKNAPVVRRTSKQPVQQKAPIKKQSIQQKAPVKKQPVQQKAPVKKMSKQSQASFLAQFNEMIQCFDGINYFGSSSFKVNSWSKNRQGQWVNSASTMASKNAPAVRKASKQTVKKQPVQQKAPVKKQPIQQKAPVKKMSKQSQASFLAQFNEMIQCFDGINYFGSSSFKVNAWSKNRQGQWVNSASTMALKNAPVVRKASKQTVKKQPVQQKAPVKKQSIQQKAPVKKMSKPSQASFLAQFNEMIHCFDGINYFGSSSFKVNAWSKNRQGQWVNSASAMALKNAPVVRRISKQPVKKQSIQKAPVKKQSAQQQRQPVKKMSKQPQYNFASEVNEVSQCFDGMNYFGKSSFKSNSWSMNRKGQWVNPASTMALKNAPAVSRSSRLSSRKQPVQQKAPVKKQPVQQKAPLKKQQVQQKASMRQAPVKKQPMKQQKRSMKRMKSVDNSARIKEQQQMNQMAMVAQRNASLKIQNQILKQFNEKKMAEEQQRKLKEQQQKMKEQQLKMKQQQQKKLQKKVQSTKQSSKQASNLRKANTVKRPVIPAGMTRSHFKKLQKKQQLVNKINKRIQELVAEKHQKQLFSRMVKQMTQHILEEKQKASIQKSIERNQAQLKKQTQAQLKKQVALKKQAPVKQAPVKTKKSYTEVVKQKASKNVKQSKTVSTKKYSASQIRMLNLEFTDLCNAFNCTSFETYSKYTTWSKNKSGMSVSSASVISARNAPRITKSSYSRVTKSSKAPRMNKRK